MEMNPKYAEYSDFAKKTIYDLEPFYSWAITKDGEPVRFYPASKVYDLDPFPEGCVIERDEPFMELIEIYAQLDKTLEAMGDFIDVLQQELDEEEELKNARL